MSKVKISAPFGLPNLSLLVLESRTAGQHLTDKLKKFRLLTHY